MAGGRPRNDWQAARERKLARLYVLSHLTWDDIKEVMREDGFNPSQRDMQKKLKALLPNDYSVCYRGYHPSSRNQATLRFSHLKFCTDDRVRKCRKTRLQPKSGSKNKTSNPGPGPDGSELTGSIKAFSNCYWDSSPRIMPCIIPSWLHVMATEYPPISYEIEKDSNEPPPLPKSCDIPTVAKCDLEGYANATNHHDDSEQATKCSTSSSNLSTEEVNNQSSLQPEVVESAVQRASIASKTLSIRFSRKLTDRYSLASLEHIKSVVRYSSSISWRSSLMSWTSSIKSRGSIASSLQQIWSNAEDETLVPGPTGTSESRQKIKSRLSEREQRIWEDLVDETQLAPPVAAEIPSYPEISLISRPCCPMLGKPKCPACGFSYSHRQAIIWATNLPTQFYTGDPMPYAHDKDHFQNTPLHFAAAKGSPDLLAMVKWLLLKRVDIEAINTSGETFMHVLNPALLSNTKEYISMLKLLAENKFPLSRRNYHSQSLANIYFAAYAPKDIPLEYLRLIGSYIKPDIYGLKCLNSEFDEKKYIAGYDTRDERQRRLNLDTLLTQCLESISRKESWTLRSMVGNLMKIPDLEKLVRDIENSGDSSLIHLIKNWPEKYEFYLRNVIHVISRLGAEVNLRDRNGDTALAIAAKRGLRFEVLLLLSCNANPNSRDYHGSGILSQATKCLLQARIDSRRYSRILSCIGLLTDNGAKVKPSVYDE